MGFVKLVVFLSVLVYALGLFAGDYSDPNHPSCPRIIDSETSDSASVQGADASSGEGYSCDGSTDESWGPLPAKISGSTIIVDFSSKGGPSDLTGVYSNNGITWEDGNTWTKNEKSAKKPLKSSRSHAKSFRSKAK